MMKPKLSTPEERERVKEIGRAVAGQHPDAAAPGRPRPGAEGRGGSAPRAESTEPPTPD